MTICAHLHTQYDIYIYIYIIRGTYYNIVLLYFTKCLCTFDLQEVELSTADVTSAEMDSLQQNIHDKGEEIRQLASLLEAKEAEEEERRSRHEKEWEDELRGKISDLKAQLTEEEDQKMKAEEELKNLQGRVREMEHKEMVVNNLRVVYGRTTCTIMHFMNVILRLDSMCMKVKGKT